MGYCRKTFIILLVSLTGFYFLSGCGKRNELIDSTDKVTTAKDKPISMEKAAVVGKGSIRVPIAKLRQDKKDDLLISNGIPFAPGRLFSDKDIAFFDDAENEIPIATEVLARWLQDGSIRSVLVQFNINVLHKYKYLTMKWGEERKTKDKNITEVNWVLPDGIILLPAQWLCDSKVIGDQVPMKKHPITKYPVTKYDQNIVKYFQKLKNGPWTGDTRSDNYYDTTHVFYQFFVRTGDEEYFRAARREAVHYRDEEIIQEGSERGKSTSHYQTRYVYVQAMIDDYLLTGDAKSLAVAGYMVEYLRDHFPPPKAFYPKKGTHFWTEREAAFPFLGVIIYYEATGEKKYFKLAKQYMNNLYRTQNEWPKRGGFIHSLYACAKMVGAKKEEYGGSPFMAGLLLEAIIKYHQITNSEVAKRSIFKALDWLIKEGLAPSGNKFLYLTECDRYKNKETSGTSMHIVYALGYGYKISGYTRKDYLTIGKRLFDYSVNNAFLGKRKHFNQNYRSSGHFLAYISGGSNKN